MGKPEKNLKIVGKKINEKNKYKNRGTGTPRGKWEQTVNLLVRIGAGSHLRRFDSFSVHSVKELQEKGVHVNLEADYLKECLELSPVAIQAEFCRMAGDVAFWNEEYRKVYKTFWCKKVEFERLESRLSLETRTMLENADSKTRVTEALVESTMKAGSQEWIKGRLELVEADCERVRLVGILESLRDKKDMLVSLGAHLREEMAGDPMLKTHMRNQHESDMG